MNLGAVLVAVLAGASPPRAPGPASATVSAASERKPAWASARIVTVAELTRELRGHKGRPVILHFWATWCVPCLTELPFLARVAKDSRRKGVDFLPVSLDSPTQKSAQHVSSLLAQRVQDARWSPILRVANVDAFMNSIDPGWEGAIPVFFAFDSDTRLRRTHLGNITPAEFDALVAWVLPAKKT
jgi:thiol-disulfide isomerase/thioredoxin